MHESPKAFCVESYTRGIYSTYMSFYTFNFTYKTQIRSEGNEVGLFWRFEFKRCRISDGLSYSGSSITSKKFRQVIINRWRQTLSLREKGFNFYWRHYEKNTITKLFTIITEIRCVKRNISNLNFKLFINQLRARTCISPFSTTARSENVFSTRNLLIFS